MATRIVNREEVIKLLDMEACIAAMEGTLKDVSAGVTAMLQRSMISHENGNKLALMPASLHDRGITGSKVIIFPSPQSPDPAKAQGIIPIFRIETGELVAIVDAKAITGIRTAATSAAGTKALAREDAKTLGILGAGHLGQLHIEAMLLVRRIEKIYIWDRVEAATEKLAAETRAKYGIEVVACKTAKEATVDSDIVCTVTSAKEPFLMGEWLKEGSHLNAVGACAAQIREIDAVAVQRSQVYADKLEAVMRDAGDLLIPMKAGEVPEDCVVGEVGQVLLGQLPGRSSASEITLFESVGIAVEDLDAAWMVYEKAMEQGIGMDVEL